MQFALSYVPVHWEQPWVHMPTFRSAWPAARRPRTPSRSSPSRHQTCCPRYLEPGLVCVAPISGETAGNILIFYLDRKILFYDKLLDKLEEIEIEIEIEIERERERDRQREREEGNVLFNDTLDTFYLRLYGAGHMVKDHSDSERGNPLPPHGLLFPK